MTTIRLYGTLRGRKVGTKDIWGPVAYEGQTVTLTGLQKSSGQHGRETLEIAVIDDERYEINANEVPGEVEE